MSEVRDNFLRATYILSKQGGIEWLKFVEAFSALTYEELEKGTGTPVLEALVTLGRNRRMLELRDDFQMIDKLAEKLKVR
jgi:hypothetical protein